MDTKTYRLHPQFWKIFAFSTIPVAAALVTGLWLSYRIHENPRAETEKLRTEEVVAQDRLLVDSLWSSIESIKSNASGLLKIRQAQKQAGLPGALPEGVLLHWAELEIRDGKLWGVRQQAVNPAWNSGSFGANASAGDVFERFYLQAAIARLNLKELRENGVAILRIKQDPHRSQEWLALGFWGASPTSVVLALVDWAEVFPIFRRWTERSEGGALRGYLIGSEGHVLLHSQKTYASSDFSGTQVFKEGVREMLRGRQVSGAGVFKGIDETSVTVAYARPGSLPIGAVVERISNAAAPNSILASVPLLLAHSSDELLQALGAFLLICLGSTFSVRTLLSQRPGEPHTQPAPPSTEFESLLSTAEETEEHDEATPEAPSELHSETQLASQFTEELLSQRAGQPQNQAARAEKILLAQFETEAVRAPDSKHIASQLAKTAARLCDSPALFFSYHEALRSAILQAHAGFENRPSPSGMAFGLNDSMLSRIQRYANEGKTASISDHPTLALLLAKRFGSPRCEAWPVSGAQGKTLGFLVVLDPIDAAATLSSQSGKIQSLEKLLKISGSFYEEVSPESHLKSPLESLKNV